MTERLPDVAGQPRSPEPVTPDTPLRPCPFCKLYTAHIEPRSKVWTGRGWQILSWHVIHHCAAGSITGSRVEMIGKTREEAVQYWNRC